MSHQSKLLVQWNCEGLKPKRDVLLEIIREKNPICICLQETKLPPNSDISIRGYKSFLKNMEVQEDGNAHGGVGIWVRNSTPAHQIKLETNLQAVAVSLMLGKRTTVCSLYLPPNEHITKDQVENLLSQLPKPFLLLGDFNAHSRLWFDRKDCQRGKVIQKIIEEQDISLLDKEKITHISRAHQTTSHIDLSIVSLDIMNHFDWDADDYFRTSDHTPIYITHKDIVEQNYEQKWIIDKADWKTFTERTEVNLHMADFPTSEAATEHLEDIINNAAEQTIPKSKGTGGRKSPPWWNDECKRAINKRKAAWKKYTTTISIVNLIAFKKARAEAQRTVRRSKRASWQDFVEGINSETSSKEAWKRINILQNKHGSRSSSSLKIGDSKSVCIIGNISHHTELKTMLQECYEFGPVYRFKEYGENNRKVEIVFEKPEHMKNACKHFNGRRKDGRVLRAYAKHTDQAQDDEQYFLDDPNDIADSLGLRFEYVSSYFSCDNTFKRSRKRRETTLAFKSKRAFGYNSPITKEELEREMGTLKNSAPGPDGIHYSMLKNLSATGQNFLLEIFNDIFNTGKLPKHWKLAHVIPILKEGKDPLKPDSYRPIALTSCVCKLFERILNRRLVRYLMEKKLISEAQAGFMKGKSPLDNLVALEHEVHETFLRKEFLLTIFFDLAKAYDTCWRYLILKELHESGMRGKLPLLVVDFLSERKFQVKSCGKLSKEFTQDMGVPQGSVLSVTLFLIAINTISKIVDHFLSYSLYVDDIRVSIPVTGKDWSRATRRIQGFLNKLVKWSNETGFRFSGEKTEVLVFHRIPGLAKDPDPKLYLYDRNKPLKVVQEKRFLGLIWDRRLNWCAHLKDLRIRASRANNILKVIIKNHRTIGCTQLLRIYRSITRAKMDYGCPIYGTASKTALKILNTAHHQALRLCTGAFRTSPVESLYIEANEPSLQDRRDMLSLQYYTRVCRLPDSTVMKCLRNSTLDARYTNSKGKPKSLSYKIRNLLQSLEINLPQIEPLYFCSVGPWEIPEVHFCNALSSHKKEDTAAVEYQTLFHVHRHQTDFEIYTDGSKGESGVAAAAVLYDGNQGTEYGVKMHDMASVFSAELQAIELGLKSIPRHLHERSCTFYSDSLSSIQAIKGAKLEDKRIGTIYELLEQLEKQKISIDFCWIPGHAGIKGNEAADTYAKNTCKRPVPDKREVPSSDCKLYIKKAIMARWQSRWENLTDNKKLKEIQPEVGKKIMALSRKDDLKLTRLRIGHTRLTHSFILTGEDMPVCAACNTPITVKHILLDCGGNIEERMSYFDHRQVTLKTLLSSNEYIPKVLAFLNSVDLYKEL